MKITSRLQKMLGTGSAILTLSFFSAIAHSQTTPAVLAQVTFSKVNYIATGEVARYTATTQRISFSVFTDKVTKTGTGEILTVNPDAFFAVQDQAFDNPATLRSTQYCLDLIRSMAVNPNSGAQMTLFLNVKQQSPGGPNFIVQRFNSCYLTTS